MKDSQVYRSRLEAERAQLLALHVARDAILVERETDPADYCSNHVERETAAGILEAETHTLREIEAALERLKAGEYGVCEDCGEAIPPKRLTAVPWAARCRDCQDRVDRAGPARSNQQKRRKTDATKVCPQCESPEITITEHDGGICRNTGYRDAGEIFLCRKCGAKGGVEELLTIFGEVSRG